MNDLQVTLKVADDARIAAIIAPDHGRLNAIFSDDLHYAHSTGDVNTKTSLMEELLSGRTKHISCDYEERNFTFPAPGIALMSGRAVLTSMTPAGTKANLLSFLAVWREEYSLWRLLAWQSCKIPSSKAP